MKRIAAFLFLSASAASAFAGQGEVCTSVVVPAGGQAFATVPLELSDSTRFECASLGSVTIPQIYAKGWRVVHAAPMMALSAEARRLIDAAGPAAATAVPTAAMAPHMTMKLIVEKL